MSKLVVDTVEDNGGRALYGTRAWLNFNGTGTVAVRGSENFSSVTDLAAGGYLVSMTSAQVDNTYSATATSGPTASYNNAVATVFGRTTPVAYESPTTSSFPLNVTVATIGYLDASAISINVTR